MKIKERLQNWLESPGNTQTALALQTGISQGAINNYLKKGRIPEPEELCKLADFFTCSVDELLGRLPGKYPEMQSKPMALNDAPQKKTVAKLRRLVAELGETLKELDP